jgi:hypothetical protein
MQRCNWVVVLSLQSTMERLCFVLRQHHHLHQPSLGIRHAKDQLVDGATVTVVTLITGTPGDHQWDATAATGL